MNLCYTISYVNDAVSGNISFYPLCTVAWILSHCNLLRDFIASDLPLYYSLYTLSVLFVPVFPWRWIGYFSRLGAIQNIMSHIFGPNLTPYLPSVSNCHTWLNPPIKNMSQATIPPPSQLYAWSYWLSTVITKPAKGYSSWPTQKSVHA